MTAANPESILDSIKKVLGVDPDFTNFDLDITMFINAAFGSLQQIGVGPDTGFFIEDNTALWSSYTSRTDLLGMVKTYVSMKVRLVFDPPATSFVLESFNAMILQLEWRINVMAEDETIVVNNDPKWWDLTDLSDFPTNAVPGDWGYDLDTGDVYTYDDTENTPAFWDVSGLSDFPAGAVIGDLGIDTATGDIWSYAT